MRSLLASVVAVAVLGSTAALAQPNGGFRGGDRGMMDGRGPGFGPGAGPVERYDLNPPVFGNDFDGDGHPGYGAPIGTPGYGPNAYTGADFGRPDLDRRDFGRPGFDGRPFPGRPFPGPAFHGPRWRVGMFVPHHPRFVVPDWRRFHLYRPMRGHHWVRFDNTFLLVMRANGLVVHVIWANPYDARPFGYGPNGYGNFYGR